MDELVQIFRVDNWYYRKSLKTGVPFDICKDGVGAVQDAYNENAAKLQVYELALRDSRAVIYTLQREKAQALDLLDRAGAWTGFDNDVPDRLSYLISVHEIPMYPPEQHTAADHDGTATPRGSGDDGG